MWLLVKRLRCAVWLLIWDGEIGVIGKHSWGFDWKNMAISGTLCLCVVLIPVTLLHALYLKSPWSVSETDFVPKHHACSIGVCIICRCRTLDSQSWAFLFCSFYMMHSNWSCCCLAQICLNTKSKWKTVNQNIAREAWQEVGIISLT